MITLIRQTYQQLTPQRQAEFAILGFYTLVCWLISAYGSYLFVRDYTGHSSYALLTPLFVELLAAAATWLFVRGSSLWITWLRFLLVPTLIVSVAHVLAVTTPVEHWLQYAAGLFFAALFGYGQHYVDNAIRHSDTNAQRAHTAAYDAQRRRLEQEQARILAEAQLAVLRLTHLEHTRNAVRDALTEAIIPTADYQIAEPPARVFPTSTEQHAERPGRLGFHAPGRTTTNQPASRSVQSAADQTHGKTCRHCGQRGLSQLDLMLHGKYVKAYGQCTKPEIPVV